MESLPPFSSEDPSLNGGAGNRLPDERENALLVRTCILASYTNIALCNPQDGLTAYHQV